MIKFSVCDYEGQRAVLEKRGQISRYAEGVYKQTNTLGGTLMYAVRKAMLPTLLEFVYPCNFDNAVAPETYLLLPHSEGVFNGGTRNFHFGVCYQGESASDVAR